MSDARVHADTWGTIARTYIRLADDRSLPVAMQDRLIAEADALTPDNPYDVHTLATGHLGFLLKPAVDRSDTGYGPGDRLGQGGSGGAISTHKSSSTIHGRVVTPSRTPSRTVRSSQQSRPDQRTSTRSCYGLLGRALRATNWGSAVGRTIRAESARRVSVGSAIS